MACFLKSCSILKFTVEKHAGQIQEATREIIPKGCDRKKNFEIIRELCELRELLSIVSEALQDVEKLRKECSDKMTSTEALKGDVRCHLVQSKFHRRSSSIEEKSDTEPTLKKHNRG